jgi:hypothetical protein
LPELARKQLSRSSKTCWRLATASGLSEQQRIADAFFAEHLIPAKLDTTALNIWTPKAP